MKYVLLLKNLGTGDSEVINVPANLPLESLSARIKLALRLPYTDFAWHRFISLGFTYVVDEHLAAEPEIRHECSLPVGPYRSSERISIERSFTVLGSSITYLQDGPDCTTHRVRCILLQRT